MHRLPRKIENIEVLFIALNWGSGHVFRSLPILKELQEQGCELTILGTKEQHIIYTHYLQKYSPLPWKGYRFKFSGKGKFALDLAKTAFDLRSDYRIIRKTVQRICQEKEIKLVLSDHVYGANSIDVESIFLTHQVHLPLPKLNPFHVLHRQFMREFSKVWILDDPEVNLAGKLSQPTEEHTTYIGLPSRFAGRGEEVRSYRTILLSGPEPYRSLFMMELEGSLDEEVEYIVIGLDKNEGRFKAVSSRSFDEVDDALRKSKEIWTRGGYTTLLDNQYLKAQLRLFPTPGQAEQEYLKSKA